MTRREELAGRLAAVEERIGAACADAGRSRDEVTLVVVTKTWPAEDVRLLAGLGVRDVGESRDQEAVGKHEACADLPLRWHYVGQVQTNKARSVAGYAAVVHSVDRERLVGALSRGAQAAGRVVRCLVQVSYDDPQQKAGTLGPRGGAAPEDVPALADLVASAPGLELGGLMTVAPREGEPRTTFDRLVALAAAVRRSHPSATDVSAGMSGDLEAAVAAGATHLRVGRAVLGPRAPLR